MMNNGSLVAILVFVIVMYLIFRLRMMDQRMAEMSLKMQQIPGAMALEKVAVLLQSRMDGSVGSIHARLSAVEETQKRQDRALFHLSECSSSTEHIPNVPLHAEAPSPHASGLETEEYEGELEEIHDALMGHPSAMDVMSTEGLSAHLESLLPSVVVVQTARPVSMREDATPLATEPPRIQEIQSDASDSESPP